MAFIWIVSDCLRKQITHYLQLFPKDRKYQIEKGMAAEVVANYGIEPVVLIGSDEDWMVAEYDISTFRISGENAYIIIKNKDGDFGTEYTLRFSEEGYDIAVEQGLLHEIQATCKLIPANPKDLIGEKVGFRAYRLEQKSNPAR